MSNSIKWFKDIKSSLYFVIIVKFTILSISFYGRATPQDIEHDKSIILKVHNVGQGNLVTVRFPNDEIMMIDAGSKGYEEPLAYQAALLELQSKPSQKKIRTQHNLPPQSPPAAQITSGQPTPHSIIYSSDFSPLARFAKNNELSFSQEDFIENLKDDLRKNELGITVKTVVISHPDVDHYNWLRYIFSKEENKLEYLILGGLPSHYIDKEFISWLRKQPKRGTKIICSAVEHDVFKNAKEIDEFFSKDKKDYVLKPFYSTPLVDSFGSNKNLFQDAFNFGENIHIRLLSVNPLHVEQTAINGDGSKVISRLNDPSDDNPDSIVLRISYVDESSKKDLHSFTVLGDATKQTYERIMGLYRGNFEALKSDVIVASHHGASSHGAADLDFIKILNPKVVLISCGHHRKFTHPKLEAYETFKEADLVRFESRHSILVNEPVKKRPLDSTLNDKENPPKKKPATASSHSPSKYIYRIHKTYYGIFSTLSSGTLKVTFNADKSMQLVKGIGPNTEEKIIPRSSQGNQKKKKDEVNVIGKERKATLEKAAQASKDYQKEIKDKQEEAKLKTSPKAPPGTPTRSYADRSQAIANSSTSSSSSTPSKSDRVLRTRTLKK